MASKRASSRDWRRRGLLSSAQIASTMAMRESSSSTLISARAYTVASSFPAAFPGRTPGSEPARILLRFVQDAPAVGLLLGLILPPQPPLHAEAARFRIQPEASELTL